MDEWTNPELWVPVLVLGVITAYLKDGISLAIAKMAPHAAGFIARANKRRQAKHEEKMTLLMADSEARQESRTRELQATIWLACIAVITLFAPYAPILRLFVHHYPEASLLVGALNGYIIGASWSTYTKTRRDRMEALARLRTQNSDKRLTTY